MPAAPWYRDLARRFGSCFLLKSIGITTFITLFFVGYLHLLKNPAYPVITMPLTAVDGLIAFQPVSLSIYFTLWVYVSLPPALLFMPDDLYRYGVAITGVCAAGLACFYFWPTAVPATALDWQGYPGSDILKGIDAGGNACPSLHVATAVFSGIWLHRLLRDTRASPAVLAANLAWCVAIVYSTLATKQHVFLDVIAGSLLGAIGAALSLSWHRPASSLGAYRPRFAPKNPS